MTNEITLTGFVQGRVDIVVEQTYAKEYKAVGWINLQPVFLSETLLRYLNKLLI